MMTRAIKAVVVGATLSVALSWSGLAWAERRSGGVIRLEEVVIEGRVQKPNAFYVLQRSSLGYEEAHVQQSFVQDIVESVEHEPFK